MFEHIAQHVELWYGALYVVTLTDTQATTANTFIFPAKDEIRSSRTFYTLTRRVTASPLYSQMQALSSVIFSNLDSPY